MNRISGRIVERGVLFDSFRQSVRMLTPSVQWKNPVMFVTYIGAIVTVICVVDDIIRHQFSWFNFQISLWLIFTVLFANLAQAIAESRGKAHAASLRQTQTQTFTRKWEGGKEVLFPFQELRKGDVIICEAGDIIPADGEVVEGVATVDESAITGESAPVIRESGGTEAR